MDNITIWQNLWFVIMYFVLFSYTILDGFDLGIGLVLPLYKNKEDRKFIINSIYPFWDGNELWLIIGTTVLFAVSPISFSAILGAFYLGFMFIFFAFTLRAASFEFLYHDLESRNKVWQVLFFTATLICTVCGMFTLGNLIIGIPINEKKEFTGTILTLINPYSAAAGLFGMNILIVHGLCYIISRAKGELRDKSINLLKVFLYVELFLFIIFILSSLILIPVSRSRFAFYLGFAVMTAGILLIFSAIKFLSGKFVFILSSICITGFWIMTGSLLFPDIIKASNDPGLSITIYNGSSSLVTLQYMAPFTIIGFLIISGYIVFIYRVFKEIK
jgi:cytochrome bd ubiquinol oxidase subunit II